MSRPVEIVDVSRDRSVNSVSKKSTPGNIARPIQIVDVTPKFSVSRPVQVVNDKSRVAALRPVQIVETKLKATPPRPVQIVEVKPKVPAIRPVQIVEVKPKATAPRPVQIVEVKPKVQAIRPVQIVDAIQKAPPARSLQVTDRKPNVPGVRPSTTECKSYNITQFMPNCGNTKLADPPKATTKSFISPVASPKPANSSMNISIVENRNVPTTVHVNVSLKLLTARTILVVVLPKCSQIDNVVKGFKSAKFIDSEKMWSIGWDDHRNLVNKIFRVPGVKVQFSNLPDFVVKMFATLKSQNKDSQNVGGVNKEKKTYKEEAEARIEKTLLDRMFPYQLRGLEFGLSKHGKVYIADEMGLGKSIQGLALARYYKSEWPLIIVCPAAVRYSWRDTFYNFLPSFDKSKLFLIEKGSDFIPLDGDTNNVIIISYSMLKNITGMLDKINAKVVIFDEAHSLKSKTAVRTKEGTKIAKTCNRIILLSGTPALSKPIELYSQLQLINSSLTPNYYKFAERYCDGKKGPFGFEANGSTNPDELKTVLSTFFMIRRYKKDVLNDLPEKMRQVVYLRGDIVEEAMGNLEKQKMELDKMRNKIENNMEKASYREKRACILEYYAKTGECKSIVAVKYIMDKYFSEDIERRKIIIFAHHKVVLDKLQAACEKRKIKAIRIDGAVTGPNRDKAIKDFQNDESVLVAILSITAAGAGVTLTAASTVLFAELHWNPGYLQQAEDRAHRIGQKDCVHVSYLIFNGTCDDYMFPMIQKKMAVLGQLMLNSEDFTNSVKKTEFISKQKHITDFFSFMIEEENGNSEEPHTKKMKFTL
uniref:SWI/SNF-related matrix-associated actin-dependent regulator of chromatin subfamily A-like protein 1 n=1 Tax=Strongyloides venezuelensis TaxID=75913 RepID=A0A0K0FM83_STRVS